MLDKLNIALIEAVQSYTPRHTNTASVLMDSLHIGREAAYRRLRGDVLFTFEEAAILSEKLRFSLDQVMNSPITGNVLFRIQMSDADHPVDSYLAWLKRDTAFYREAACDPTTYYAVAGNSIPPEVYLRFKPLANFKFFKWLYQHDLCNGNSTYEEMHLPQVLLDAYDDYAVAARLLPNSCYVFDSSIYMQWIMAIRTFRAMHLISDESVAELKRQLSLMMDDMRDVMAAGAYPNGNKLQVYLSDVSLGHPSSYLANSKIKASGLGLFSLNAIRTLDPVMSDYIYQWIQKQSRFSTLVSCCGELRRINYLKRQRENLAMLD